MSEDIVYSWRGREDAESETAQIVGSHLMALAARLGRPFDAITPDDVIEDASKPDSPLRKYFEWDDKAAAVEYRRVQARFLLSSVRYRVEAGAPKRIGFVNVRVEGVGRAYVPYSLAEHSESLKRQAKEGALKGLRAWQTRYAELSDAAFYDLIGQAVGALEEELSAPVEAPQIEAAA